MIKKELEKKIGYRERQYDACAASCSDSASMRPPTRKRAARGGECPPRNKKGPSLLGAFLDVAKSGDGSGQAQEEKKEVHVPSSGLSVQGEISR